MQINNQLIYLDNNATTPVDPRVIEAMLPYFSIKFGNAASNKHKFGWEANDAVDDSRRSIAQAINATDNSSIVFTSGATESINLALKGVLPDMGKDHVVTTQTEHKATIDSCNALKKNGMRVSYLSVGKNGLIDISELEDTISAQTYLVSIMAVNNETGVIQYIDKIGEICRERGVYFHTDATQAVGKVPFDVQKANVSLASFTAHKIYGPKGIGALYIDERLLEGKLSAQIDGGRHERGYRSGTLNVPGIVGFAEAIKISMLGISDEGSRIGKFRDILYNSIITRLDHVHFNGHQVQQAPGTLNLSFEFIDPESLLLEMANVAVSTGSACTSGQADPSHVLRAMGVSEELARASIRFSIGRFNTEDEIDKAADICVNAVMRIRAMSPHYAIAKLKRIS